MRIVLGKTAYPKGLAYVERAHSPQRLTRPLRRLRDGSFAPVAWDEALAEIASTLLRLRERHGPQTVLYYSASGTKGLLNAAGLAFWRLFGGCTTPTATCAGRRGSRRRA